jgi:hypothetical protein
MEPEIKNLAHKTNLIMQALENKTLTIDILNDYMNDFRALNVDLYRKLVSLYNPYSCAIYTDDDIDQLEFYLRRNQLEFYLIK